MYGQILFSGINIIPLEGVQTVQHTTVPNVQKGLLRPLHAPWRKKSYTLNDYLTLPKCM